MHIYTPLSSSFRYRRFLQSKDLSVKSEDDMACVLGRKRKQGKEGEEPQQPLMVSPNVTVCVCVCVYHSLCSSREVIAVGS